jgi:isochorismate hydrolase
MFRVVTKQHLYYNIHASSTFITHFHTFQVGDALVDQAETGDRVVLYAMAQYPLWINDCKMAKIAVQVAAV